MDVFAPGCSVLYTRSNGSIVSGRVIGQNPDGTYRLEYQVDGDWRYHYMVRPEKIAGAPDEGVFFN